MTRTDVTFASGTDTCHGWLYLPPNRSGARTAAVAMAHGLSGVKEMDLPVFAERFCAAGLAVLVFDYRHFGASTGLPRGQLFPALQLEDYRNAVSFLQEQPSVDPQRIGVWGTSFSGGHVLHLGAFDRRVKAVVSQVPTISAFANAQRIHHPEALAAAMERISEDRRQRFRSGGVTTVPVVAPPGMPCLLPGRLEYERLMEQAPSAPGWQNAVTTESFEKILEYAPAAGIRYISPTPLLMIIAGRDTLTPADLAFDAFSQAVEPKKVVWLQCTHHEVYHRADALETALTEATNWFTTHLEGGR